MSQSVQLVVGGIRYGGLMQNMECSNENEINNSTVHIPYLCTKKYAWYTYIALHSYSCNYKETKIDGNMPALHHVHVIT